MPELIENPATIEAAGTKPKRIEEFVGRVNTSEARVSIARMRSPQGWLEPGQRPEFDEYTVVLAGGLHVEHESGASHLAHREERRVGDPLQRRVGDPVPGQLLDQVVVGAVDQVVVVLHAGEG